MVICLLPAHPGSPGQRAVKWVCVCVKDVYIEQVGKGHKCAMSAEMAVWLRNCNVSIANARLMCK